MTEEDEQTAQRQQTAFFYCPLCTTQTCLEEASIVRVAEGESPSISGDGNVLVFVDNKRIFAHCVSTWMGRHVADGYPAKVASNGRMIVYATDDDGIEHRRGIFLLDLNSGVRSRIALPYELPLDRRFRIEGLSISADGRFVTFDYPGTNSRVIYLFDSRTGETAEVSLENGGIFPEISSSGKYIVYSSWMESDAANGSTDVIFIYDVESQTTSIIHPPVSNSDSRWGSPPFSFSGDERFVSFDSTWDSGVAIYDRTTATTAVVCCGAQGRLSETGRYLAFAGSTESNKLEYSQVFVHDRTRNKTTTLVGEASGELANGMSWEPSVSSNGRFVAFTSRATNLVSSDDQFKENSSGIYLVKVPQ